MKRHHLMLILLFLLANASVAGWEKLNTGTRHTQLNCITVHHSLAAGKVWACGNDGVILYSADGGNSWTLQNSGTSANLYSITFKEIVGGPVFAAGAGGIVLRTTDDGTTWTQIPSGTTATLHDHSDFGWIIVGDSGIVLRSTDNGLTWARKQSGTTARLHSVAGAFSMYAVGDNGTVIKGSNGGESWQVVPTGMQENLLGVPMFGSLNSIVGAGGLILYSSNLGTSWGIKPSKTNSTLRSIEFSTGNNSRLYAVGDNGVILKTTDAGVSWERQATPTKTNLRSVFFYLNDNIGFACGDSGTILRTTDGGGGFIPVADSLEDMFPLALGNRWEYNTSWFHNILSSLDLYTSFVGRATLTVIGAVHDADSIRWIMREETEGRYCRREWLQRETCYTIQGSTTFELIEQHAWRHRLSRTQRYYTIFQSVVPFGYDLNDPTFLYRYWYPDSASTASIGVQDDRLHPSVRYSFLFKADSGIISASGQSQYITGESYGSSHRLITGRLTDVAEQTIGLPHGFALFQNYPNPFNLATRIEYAIPKTSHVSLKVYDLLGREVTTLVDEVQGTGLKFVTFDASGLASGVYLYRITGISFSQTKKLLLIR